MVTTSVVVIIANKLSFFIAYRRSSSLMYEPLPLMLCIRLSKFAIYILENENTDVLNALAIPS